MKLKYLFDVHVKLAVANGLRRRGVDVATAQELGLGEADDSELLDQATQLDRVLFSQDDDLLAEADIRLTTGERFAGLVFAPQRNVTVGMLVRDLDLIANVLPPAEIENRIEYLPLE